MHDEEFVEFEEYVLVQAFEECCANFFDIDHLSFQIVGTLDSIAPNLCVPWLSMLKNIGTYCCISCM
jgi:hypothetical protein